MTLGLGNLTKNGDRQKFGIERIRMVFFNVNYLFTGLFFTTKVIPFKGQKQ